MRHTCESNEKTYQVLYCKTFGSIAREYLPLVQDFIVYDRFMMPTLDRNNLH